MRCPHCDQEIKSNENNMPAEQPVVFIPATPENLFTKILRRRYTIFITLLVILLLWSFIYNDGDVLSVLMFCYLAFVGLGDYFKFLVKLNIRVVNLIFPIFIFLVFYGPIIYLLVNLKKLQKEKLYLWYSIMLIIVLLAAHGCTNAGVGNID